MQNRNNYPHQDNNGNLITLLINFELEKYKPKIYWCLFSAIVLIVLAAIITILIAIATDDLAHAFIWTLILFVFGILALVQGIIYQSIYCRYKYQLEGLLLSERRSC